MFFLSAGIDCVALFSAHLEGGEDHPGPSQGGQQAHPLPGCLTGLGLGQARPISSFLFLTWFYFWANKPKLM